MKLKATITGPKVHGVGYRYFLMDTALGLSLLGFNAGNQREGRTERVVAFIEGDEQAIADFKKIIETTRPEGAEVSDLTFADYDGEVMQAGQYAQVCTAHQLHKAIPLLLDIRDSNKRIEETTGRIDETARRIDETTRKIEETTRKIDETTRRTEENTQTIPTILDEVRGLHAELTIDADWKRRMESDIKAIKAKIGIR